MRTHTLLLQHLLRQRLSLLRKNHATAVPSAHELWTVLKVCRVRRLWKAVLTRQAV